MLEGFTFPQFYGAKVKVLPEESIAVRLLGDEISFKTFDIQQVIFLVIFLRDDVTGPFVVADFLAGEKLARLFSDVAFFSQTKTHVYLLFTSVRRPHEVLEPFEALA